jgi:hypothetical protein
VQDRNLVLRLQTVNLRFNFKHKFIPFFHLILFLPADARPPRNPRR